MGSWIELLSGSGQHKMCIYTILVEKWMNYLLLCQKGSLKHAHLPVKVREKVREKYNFEVFGMVVLYFTTQQNFLCTPQWKIRISIEQ